MAFSNGQKAAIYYHNIFNYPLTKEELTRWQTSFKIKKRSTVVSKDSFYFVKGREEIIKSRLINEKASEEKLKIARQAANILRFLPTVIFVGITGSLAMNAATPQSDIDLLVVTKKNALWTTRLLSYLILKINKYKIRKPGEKDEKDKLCLNMWMDESDLYFSEQNIFTSHEIAQIVVLVNKNNSYERLVKINKWIFKYWPNAINYQKKTLIKNSKSTLLPLLYPIEKVAYLLQLWHMSKKRSREVVSSSRAFFHPFDWGAEVIKKLEL